MRSARERVPVVDRVDEAALDVGIQREEGEAARARRLDPLLQLPAIPDRLPFVSVRRAEGIAHFGRQLAVGAHATFIGSSPPVSHGEPIPYARAGGEASVPADNAGVHDRVEVDIDDVRTVFRALGAPGRVRASMPELRYEWSCGCRVVVDSDLLERRWEACPGHRTLLAFSELRTA